MQRQFIFEVTVATFGILGIGCGTPFGKDTSSGIEVTRISPTPTSNTDASTLIPTLETNLTYGPKPKTYEVNATGQYNLALKLEKAGKLTEALPLYIKAAEQNVREAQYNLGYMYEHGEGGLQQDISLAVQWYRKAAGQGLPEAQHMLGILCTEGRGVPENYMEAAQWHGKAAAQNFLPAEYQMGVLYALGQGVEISAEIAAKWFLQAAEKDLADAQFQIGYRYAKGEGVEQDVIKAYTWLNIAALAGNHKGALEAKRDLIRHMKPDQVTTAQIATADYLKNHKKDN